MEEISSIFAKDIVEHERLFVRTTDTKGIAFALHKRERMFCISLLDLEYMETIIRKAEIVLRFLRMGHDYIMEN